jgi:hypothetical protein
MACAAAARLISRPALCVEFPTTRATANGSAGGGQVIHQETGPFTAVLLCRSTYIRHGFA